MSSHPEMVERVARAINPAAWGLADHADDVAEAVRFAVRRTTSIQKAKDAIAVMREPTAAMVESGAKAAYEDYCEGDPSSAWPECDTAPQAGEYRSAYLAAHKAAIDEALR